MRIVISESLFEAGAILSCLVLSASVVSAQTTPAPFDPDRWDMTNAEVDTRFGRECVTGAAILNEVEFRDGVIEVDIATPDRTRAYPGIVFRAQDETNLEWVYLRPHRSPFYSDAIQYTPMINGMTGWQLYNGEGYTSGADFPADEWVNLRIEVTGARARVFVGQSSEPNLTVSDLKHGESSGAIGIYDSSGRGACFSNFRFTSDHSSAFDEPTTIAPQEGVITSWEVSRAIKAERVNRDRYPGFLAISQAGWQAVTTEPNGLVDLSRYASRSEGGPDLVFARTTVNAPDIQTVEFSFGYSDAVDLFHNGRKVFSGNSAYRSRDPSFLGIVGPFDAVTLTLEKGLNEIFLMVTESFGGWGFLGAFDRNVPEPQIDHARATRAWETSNTFLTPESVLFDPDRKVLYVTNYDIASFSAPERTGYITKMNLDGEVLEERWVSDLKNPAGMSIHEDILFVAERGFLTEISLATGEILSRHPIPNSEFLNDVSVDDEGYVYITDTYPSSHIQSKLFRVKDGEVEEWYGGREINRANGLFRDDQELLIGNSGDGLLKAIHIEHRSLRNIACFGAGVIDGIRLDNNGNYIVSKWDGQIFSVTPDGEVTEIINLISEGLNTADFEYLPEQNLLVIPTFLGNRVVAYRIN